ncbi:MAG: DUF433 domain-containing protein [Nitrospira sp.]|nr:DUF433 domain-containing protein [Nitrospira sp.]
MSGALCFRGTRVPVQSLFGYLEGELVFGGISERLPDNLTRGSGGCARSGEEASVRSCTCCLMSQCRAIL